MKLSKIAFTSILLGFIILVVYIIILIQNNYLSVGGNFSLDTAKAISPFISAFVGVFFSLAGVLLLYVNFNLQTKVQKNNQILIQKNQFESIFFNLLSLHNEIVKNIDTYMEHPKKRKEEEHLKGRVFFDAFTNLIESRCEDEGVEELMNIYNEYYTRYNTDIAHYFRNLYHIVNFVDKNSYFKEVEKSPSYFKQQDYIKLLRAQLSNSEITCLALNGLSERGKSFKPLIEKYKLLKNLNFELELNRDEFYSTVPAPEVLSQHYEHLKPIFEEQKRN